jgi:hypothetical protein
VIFRLTGPAKRQKLAPPPDPPPAADAIEPPPPHCRSRALLAHLLCRHPQGKSLDGLWLSLLPARHLGETRHTQMLSVGRLLPCCSLAPGPSLPAHLLQEFLPLIQSTVNVHLIPLLLSDYLSRFSEPDLCNSVYGTGFRLNYSIVSLWGLVIVNLL